MKIIVVAISIALSLSSYVFCQNVSIQSTAEVSNPDPQNFWTQNLGSDESGYYLIREIGPITNPQIILEKYDLNLNLLFEKNIESSSGILGDSKRHFQTILGNQELLVFLTSWNKEKSESGLWIKRMSVEGEPVGEEIQLLTNKSESLFKSSDYKVAISPDGSKFTVLTEPVFDKKATETFKMSVFNTSDLKKITEKNFDFSLEMERYPKNQVFVSNNGIAFAFKEAKISSKEFKYYLTSLSSSNSYLQELNLKENRLNQFRFLINTDGILVGFGLLADIKKYTTQWQNIWQIEAGVNGILTDRIEPLGAALLSKVIGEKKASKDGAALNNFLFKDVIENPKGGYLLITEELNESKTAVPGQTGTNTIYDYQLNFGGILVISYNKSNNREWGSFYDKKQKIKTKNPNLSLGSFAYGIVENKLHMVWNYTELEYVITFPKPHWIDKSGNKIAVMDVFGEEARYPTFLTSINLDDGVFSYSERTFSSFPLKDIQRENNFMMSADPSIFFSTPKSIIILSRMTDEFPKKIKFSTISFD